jgi:predicted ATPase/DNA-binding winged helix-turn-helix (wHTH) protein
MDGHAISFGPFRLLAAQRLLLEGDNPVRLGSRAFDILAALVERPGEVVSKKELIARVWPKTFVEDANLKIQVSALRRALGDGQGGHRYVVTVPGRGYNFVAAVRREERSRVPLARTSVPSAVHNLPFAATRMIGREDAAAALVSRLSRHRLVTIIGPGGIGKTTVALAVAERMIGGYEHGVWLVDLAPLGDPHLVSSAVATVLGLEIRSEDLLPGLVAALKDRRMLLLLDNCEHVIETTASLAAAVISGAPGVNILATSREPLGVAGESDYRLGPLGSPQPSRLTAAEAEIFPAVQLFVERATAVVEDFALTDGNAPLVAEICRRLDGLPLAIEFAAPRVEVLGVEGLAARLDDSLTLLRARRRAGFPRHQTMRAVIDWSYGLLSENDQRFFRALGMFTGGFSVEAVTAVATDPVNTRIDTIDRLADLVGKSLVVVDVSGAKPRFRLLDTTRAFAIEKLDESGERERIVRRHAKYYRDLFARAEAEVLARRKMEWLADYAREVDNLRSALDWSFSPDGGDISVGIALTAAAVPLWVYLSLIEECRRRVERALAALATAIADARLEMKLQAALATSLGQAGGAGTKTESAWTRSLDLAGSLGDVDYQLRALFGLWQIRDREALALAQRFAAVASTPGDRLIGDQLMGHSCHIQGNQGNARRHLERIAANHVASADSESRIIRFDVNEHPTIFLARILWLQGLPVQAMAMAERSVEHAQVDDHAKSLCFALAFGACPIALWVGNLDLAEQYIEVLHETSNKHALTLWHALGLAHRGVLLVRRGDIEAGLRELRAAFEECRVAPTGYRVLIFISELAGALGRAGQTSEGLTTVNEALERAERTAEGWIMPELLHVKGELLRLDGEPGTEDSAEGCFLQALQLAGIQGAPAWELRAATSLARLLRDQHRSADAIACLQPIYDRFTEGFGTADLIAAKRLLDELRGAGGNLVTSVSGAESEN